MSFHRLSLFWRVFLVDGIVLVVAVVLLAIGPVTVSAPVRLEELAILLGGLAAMLLVTLGLLRRTLRPLEALTEKMRHIDPLSPGDRVVVDVSDADVAALSLAFNDMLTRLEDERRESARMALSVQESERGRVARELHDEVGQTLTALLLMIEGLAADAPVELGEPIEELRETARMGAEDVRRIAQRLRPEALDELGLRRALLALCARFADRSRLRIDKRIARDLQLDGEEELVVYRVAQEALTNIVRHAQAQNAGLSLAADDGDVVLSVRDDGRGATPDELTSSTFGIRGMRERALLIGAALTVDSTRGRGTEVVLRIPGHG